MGRTKPAEEATDARLSAKGVCDIIRACHKHNVSSLKFEGLALEFGHNNRVANKEAAAAWDKSVVAESEQQDLQDRDYDPTQHPDFDQLMVENPVEFERMLASRDTGDEAE